MSAWYPPGFSHGCLTFSVKVVLDRAASPGPRQSGVAMRHGEAVIVDQVDRDEVRERPGLDPFGRDVEDLGVLRPIEALAHLGVGNSHLA